MAAPPAPQPHVYALVDCNNFYVSCERAFDPRLEHRPVAVLSNNDGCIIARSNEVKALGVPMGAPYFAYRAVLRKHRVEVFSSNYALYGDMSDRVMATLRTCAPEVEVYSIDEAFLRYRGAAATGLDLEALARQARTTVRQWTGIPTSIGIAPTKTLAKIANRFAKREPALAGVLDLTRRRDLDGVLELVPVEDVWGIGPRWGAKLRARGITTARRLRDANEAWVKKHLTVVGLRIVYELRGLSCLPLEEAPSPKRMITCSRSFGAPVEDPAALREAVATFATRAAEKLRAQGSAAGVLRVFVTTKYYGPGPHYTNAATLPLSAPTAYTPALVRAALRGLERLYRPGYRYRKAGVMLLELAPASVVQRDLFAAAAAHENAALMAAVDALNARWGRGTVQVAAALPGGGTARATAGTPPDAAWRMRQGRRSPRYTTRWAEVPRVR